MPTFEDALDAALSAPARGPVHALRASEGLAEAYPDRPAGRVLIALAHIAQGDLDAAEGVTLGDSPVDDAARASISLERGRLDEAKVRIEEALSRTADDPVVLGVGAHVMSFVDPNEALRLARRLVRLRPHSSRAYLVLLRTLGLLGKDPEADALVDHPPEGFADSIEHVLVLCDRAMRRHDSAEAERIARGLTQIAPDAAAPWSLLAKALFAQARMDEATTAARFALEVNRRDLPALRVLRRIAEARGEKEETRRLMEAIRLADPLHKTTRLFENVKRLYDAGRHEEMLDALDRLGRLPAPFRRRGERMRLLTLARLGDTLRLRIALEEAEFLGLEATIAQAELLLREGDPNGARSLLEPLWRDARSTTLAPFLLRARDKAEPEAAHKLARELIASPPDSVYGCLGIILALTAVRYEEELVEFVGVAFRRFPESRNVRRSYVRILTAKRRWSEAWRVCDELDPDSRRELRRYIFVSAQKAVLRWAWRTRFGKKTG